MRNRLYILMIGALLLGARAGAQDQQQVNVAVKIVEFQTDKTVETGLSAYFQHRERTNLPYGEVYNTARNGTIEAADITFPSSASAITVFLDRLHTNYGDFEVVLQGLVSQNRAFILSRPKVMVQVGQDVPTVIETTQDEPYEDTVVVGQRAVRTTSFRATGVALSVKANRVVDDDGNPNTTSDIYIQLTIQASIKELGTDIDVGFNYTGGSDEFVKAPLFFTRSVNTTVWVRHGEVLILGGLYRNTKQKDLDTLPWLTQGEDFANNLIQRAVPFSVPQVPLAATMGNQKTDNGRRELVFLLKAELWRPAYTVADEFGFTEAIQPAEGDKKKSPTDVIKGVIGGISELPQNVVQGVSGGGTGSVSSSLGGDRQ